MKDKLFRKKILMWIFQIAVVLAIAAVVSICFCQSIVMQEGSMEPTIGTSDKVLMNIVAYKMGEPKRGDIIAFKKDDKENSSMHIKRIIGLPGETIQIKDGLILINGKTYKEQKDFPLISNPGRANTEMVIGKGEYFVLGDNRNNSDDSRFADIENVKKKYIEGKLWFCISPFNKIGFLSD